MTAKRDRADSLIRRIQRKHGSVGMDAVDAVMLAMRAGDIERAWRVASAFTGKSVSQLQAEAERRDKRRTARTARAKRGK